MGGYYSDLMDRIGYSESATPPSTSVASGVVARIRLLVVMVLQGEFRAVMMNGGSPHKESQPASEITPPHMSVFHSRTRLRPAHPSGASRAHPHLSSLHVLTRAQRTRVHFSPHHWLLCHLRLY